MLLVGLKKDLRHDPEVKDCPNLPIHCYAQNLSFSRRLKFVYLFKSSLICNLSGVAEAAGDEAEAGEDRGGPGDGRQDRGPGLLRVLLQDQGGGQGNIRGGYKGSASQ